jgi:integrase
MARSRPNHIVKRRTATGEVRYLVRVGYVDAATGERREMGKTFRTKRDAEAWRDAQRAERSAGPMARPSRSTLTEFLDQWLAGLNDVSGRTREDYENIARRYLRPLLGARRLDQITTPMVREMLATLARPEAEGGRGLKPRTVPYVHAVLRLALNQAVADGKLPRNPAVGKRMVPARVRREPSVLSAAQVTQLLDATRDDPHHALWAVLTLTGLRPSEALALRWSDVNLDRRELRVMRKLRRPKNGTAWVIEDCKTDKSRRVVPLVPAAVEALACHRDRQEVERLTAPRYAAHDFVFADGAGEPSRADGVHKYHWLPTLVRLNLPRVRLYDARHSCATMLLESGVPMRVVQEILGHASMILTADTYSHVTPAFKRQAADALADFLEKRQG